MRPTTFRLSILTLAVSAVLALAPAASAKSIIDNLFVNGTKIGTVTLTQGGMCNGNSISSTSICVDVQMTSGDVRLGGPVIGFSGNVNVNGNTKVSDVSFGALRIGACGGVGKETICLDSNGSDTTSSLFFVLSNADTSTGISLGDVHVAGSFCGNSPTCYASSSPTTVPEPASLSLLGAGLLALAGLARRRLVS